MYAILQERKNKDPFALRQLQGAIRAYTWACGYEAKRSRTVTRRASATQNCPKEPIVWSYMFPTHGYPMQVPVSNLGAETDNGNVLSGSVECGLSVLAQIHAHYLGEPYCSKSCFPTLADVSVDPPLYDWDWIRKFAFGLLYQASHVT
jgi:hypothetical protein